MFLIIDSSTNISLMLYLVFLFNVVHYCSLLLHFSVVAENCCELYILVSRSAEQVKYAECTIDTTSYSRHVIETTDTI